MAIQFISINSKGLNHPAKRKPLWKEALTNKSDILCAQETHFCGASAPICQNKHFPHIFFANADSKTKGVMTAIRDTVTFVLHTKFVDAQGRYLVLVCDINQVTYTIVNVYAPNKHQVRFFHKLMHKVDTLKRGLLVLCGDFNIIPDPSIDTTRSKKRILTSLQDSIHKEGLYDVWRCLHASERDFTFFSAPHHTYTRIDFFLVDQHTLTKSTSSTINNITWSDHASITLSIKDTSVITTTPIWRVNSFLLQQPESKKVIEDHLLEFFTINEPSVQNHFTLWNAHKAFIRGIFIQLGARARRQRQKKLQNITDEIFCLETKNKQQSSPLVSKRLHQLRNDLRLLLLEDFEKKTKRLKMNYYAHGNRAGKLLAQQLKGHRSKTKIPYILHPMNKSKMQHPQDIADAFSNYYSSLYNLKEDATTFQPTTKMINDFLEQITLPTLSQQEKEYLSAPFTIEEIHKTIDSLPANKSPGPDGFTGDYYQAFKTILSPHLGRVFNAAAASSSFPPEMLRALIVTLPKPGKNPDTPANFRPISLLNADLKIYAKIIANRLIDILPHLIHPDQTGFTRGRQTSDATRRLINIVHTAATQRGPSLLLALDAEKAFDRVHWGYLEAALGRFGFSGSILSAIMALYSNPSAQVYTSGVLSKLFSITNGTRQGCPLSPLIFNPILEPLATFIRKHQSITGFITHKSEHVISLFADDIILMLTNPTISLASVHDTLQMFTKISYFKVNENKSYILGIGIDPQLKNTLSSRFPYTWCKEGINYLGITLTASTDDLFRANYIPFLSSLLTKLQNLSKSELLWSGRLAAFKMVILPQLIYLFRSLPILVPNWYFSKLQSLLNRFLWKGKKARWAFKNSVMSRKVGGVGNIVIKDYYLASILAQLRSWFPESPNPRWQELEENQIPNKNLYNYLMIQPTNVSYNQSLAPSMKASLQAWNILVKNHSSNSLVSPLQIPIASLSGVIPDLRINHWTDQGITHIEDLRIGSTMKTFRTLQIEYNLEQSEYYRYMQICHFIKTTPPLSIQLPWRIK